MLQKDVYKTMGIDLTGVQVLKGMISFFVNVDINSRKEILSHSIYELCGNQLGQQQINMCIDTI